VRDAIPKSKVGAVVCSMLAVLLLACIGWPAPASAVDFSYKECDPTEIREYSPPLRGMRAVHSPPYQMRDLPFGPPEMEIVPLGLTHLWAGSGEVGYYLDGRDERVKGPDWITESRLVAVDRKGKPQRILRQRVQRVAKAIKLDAIDLGFKVGPRPRFYRVDLEVRGATGKRIASYADYFRVMRRKVDVRLSLDRNSYRPGETVLMRLENYGTIMIGTGFSFALEIFDGTSWRESPAEFYWPSIGLGLGAGWAQECQSVLLPSDLTPGRYRLTKRYSTSWAGSANRTVRAMFDVQP
jgi:hypothetical protein